MKTNHFNMHGTWRQFHDSKKNYKLQTPWICMNKKNIYIYKYINIYNSCSSSKTTYVFEKNQVLGWGFTRLPLVCGYMTVYGCGIWSANSITCPESCFFHKSQHSEKKITRSRSLSTYTYSFKIALFKTKEGNIKHNKNNKINCSKVDCDKNKCSLSIHYLRHLTCLRWWPQSLAPWQHWPWSWSLLALSSTEWESDRLAQVGTAKPAWRKEILMAY